MPKDGTIQTGFERKLTDSFLAACGVPYTRNEYHDRHDEMLRQESGMVNKNPMLRTSQTLDREDEEERKERELLNIRLLTHSARANLTHTDIVNGLEELINKETAWLDMMKRAKDEISQSDNSFIKNAFNSTLNQNFIQRSEARITSREEILTKLKNGEIKSDDIPEEIRMELIENARPNTRFLQEPKKPELAAVTDFGLRPSGWQLG